MKAYLIEHDGRYNGGLSIIVADTIGRARNMCKAKLRVERFSLDNIKITEIDIEKEKYFYENFEI